MEKQTVVPEDIQKDAEEKYPRSLYSGTINVQKMYTKGRMDERAKGNWTTEDMTKAYWGGIEGSINDYSEAVGVGGEIRGIKVGGGAKHWLEEYKKQKDQ
jgi:hypothetical protein